MNEGPGFADILRPASTPSIWRGMVAGVVAGLAAAAAMNAFQAVATSLAGGGGDGEPATDKAADRVRVALTGAQFSDAARPVAGQAVHYAVGAALGAGYAVAAEYSDAVTAGFGTAFGGAAAVLLDEAAVPAAGLGPAPTQTPASTHAYALASHLVFGGVAEAVRRLARGVLR